MFQVTYKFNVTSEKEFVTYEEGNQVKQSKLCYIGGHPFMCRYKFTQVKDFDKQYLVMILYLMYSEIQVLKRNESEFIFAKYHPILLLKSMDPDSIVG